MGYSFVNAEKGDLASGLGGEGRLADIYKIVDAAEIILTGYKKDLLKKKILIVMSSTLLWFLRMRMALIESFLERIAGMRYVYPVR